MGSQYSFTSSQLQFVTGLPKFEWWFSGLLVIAGTNYQPSKADLIRSPRTTLTGQLVPFSFYIHIFSCARFFCCFANFSYPPGAHVNSSFLAVAMRTPAIWTLAHATALHYASSLGDPFAPVLSLSSSLMLDAVQGVAFDSEAVNDPEIWLFYKLSLRLLRDLVQVNIRECTWPISLMKVVAARTSATKLSGFEFINSNTRAFLTFKIRFQVSHDFLRERVLGEYERTRKGQQYGVFDVVQAWLLVGLTSGCTK